MSASTSTPAGPGADEPLADPAAELAALGQALRAHVARAEFFGVERTERPAAAPGAQTAAPAPETAPRPTASRPQSPPGGPEAVRQAPQSPTGPPQGRPEAAEARPQVPQEPSTPAQGRSQSAGDRPGGSSKGPGAASDRPGGSSTRPGTSSNRPGTSSNRPPPPQTGPVTADPRFAPTHQAAQAAGTLEALAATVSACTACGLCETRTQTVFADGSARARVMFIGEAPGADEDRTGVPFVGRAGQLLTDIITKGMGLGREDVYIANVLKCRPPGNRDPQPAEKQLCTPFLERQIELVDPEVLIPLGRHASNHLLGQDAPMGQLRGRVHSARGRKVVPTFHPAYLLRSPAMKKPTWADIQLAMAELGLRPPG